MRAAEIARPGQVAPTFPVTVCLSGEGIREPVEAAAGELLATAGLQIDERDEPATGSWFRRMRAGFKKVAQSGVAREAALAAARAADTRLVLAQDATITATLMQNLGPVLTSLQPAEDAVLRAGALLIVKAGWAVSVFQLTAAQQALLDHRPQLASSPYEIIAALATGLGVQAAHAGYSVLSGTATNWITRLAGARQAGHLETGLKKIRRYKLIIIDLCRHRNYADGAPHIAGLGSLRRFSHRHSPVSWVCSSWAWELFSACWSEAVEEREGRVCWAVAAWFRGDRRGEGQRLFLDGHVGVEVGVGGADVGVA